MSRKVCISAREYDRLRRREADEGLGEPATATILGTTIKWSLGSVLLATLGGVLWWKWSQIGQSGVDLDFAIKRAVSYKFLEGRNSLVAAWEADARPSPKTPDPFV